MKQREVPAFYVAYFVKGMVYISVDADTGAIGCHRNPHFTTLFTFKGQAEEILEQVKRDLNPWAFIGECHAADPRVLDTEKEAMDAWLAKQSG